MICPNCGKENDEARTACFNCGQPLRAAAAPAGPPPPPTPPPVQPPAPSGGPPTAPAAAGGPPGPPIFTAPPPPVAYPAGGAPPPGGPARGFPALWAGVAGFGVVAAVGLLLFFTVLKPKSTPAPAPVPTTPVVGPTNPGPTNPGPTNPGPTNPGPTNPGPTNPGPTNPGPPSGGGANIAFRFCGNRGGADGCVNPANKTGPGRWQLPAGPGRFEVWLGVTNEAPGDTVEIDLLDPNTGQALTDPSKLTLTGQPNCSVDGAPGECLTFLITTSNGGAFRSGVKVEAQIQYNGQLLDFGHPEVLTLV